MKRIDVQMQLLQFGMKTIDSSRIQCKTCLEIRLNHRHTDTQHNNPHEIVS